MSFLLPLYPFTFAIIQYFSFIVKELIDILTRAAEVRDETGAAENTASKVGGILTYLIDLIGESILSAGLSFNVSANGITLIVKQYDDEGCAFNIEI